MIFCFVSYVFQIFFISSVVSILSSDTSLDRFRVDESVQFTNISFPADFLFGCATASYQVEGAWNADGKGENIWDHLVHTKPAAIKNKENGDVACDSYHLYKDDIHLIKNIGFDVYRFSISWSRILPEGDTTKVNYAGVDYYHVVIDELLKNRIQPMITIYHWDLPQYLQEMGGWLNPLISDYMEDFADILFRNYGPKVKWWITINEPMSVVTGYTGDKKAPSMNLDSPANYIVAHNMLRAHSQVYRLYDRKYRSLQQGKVSITIDAVYLKEKTELLKDIEARDRAWAFYFEWFSHPIYSVEGDYPKKMREIVDLNSKKEGRRHSRLPKFTKAEVEAIKGSADFFALNHYTTRLISQGNGSYSTLWENDVNAIIEFDQAWPDSKADWLKVVPWGFRELLRYIKNKYNNPAVFITENGYCSGDELNDIGRINYYREYLSELVNAKNYYGCNVIGYTAWSILDNFEWNDGYGNRFGMIHVNFSDPKRKRTPKKSSEFFKELLRSHIIPPVNK